MSSYRNNKPQRTCTEIYNNYRQYKPHLREDFNRKCGYSDCSDFWFGGSRTFHIDHFKPKSKFPELTTIYSNLVYCCSYVNIQKSDDEGDYIDPCDVDYNEHFERDNTGNILPKMESIQANYMFKKLKLYLKRYQIIWMLDELKAKKEKLGILIENTPDQELKERLAYTYYELDKAFTTYMYYLSLEQ